MSLLVCVQLLNMVILYDLWPLFQIMWHIAYWIGGHIPVMTCSAEILDDLDIAMSREGGWEIMREILSTWYGNMSCDPQPLLQVMWYITLLVSLTHISGDILCGGNSKWLATQYGTGSRDSRLRSRITWHIAILGSQTPAIPDFHTTCHN